MTPPVRTVVFPPSYGVTSVLLVSINTRRPRLPLLLPAAVPLDALDPEELEAAERESEESEVETEEREAQVESESSERRENAPEETLDRDEERLCPIAARAAAVAKGRPEAEPETETDLDG